ncbi:hypothetical protein PG997_000402 [Apiospora hydei]|uniref:Uncharacterized protein n=1 Tax=Apiospora hydei TaxID=1337664 RepID=A0ABR1XAN4_9PEZI
MSVTSFPDIPLTFGVMYGCTQEVMNYVLQYLRTLPRPALHPLMLPMMFAELERKRLLEALRDEAGNLSQRVLEMEKRLSEDPPENDAAEKDVVATTSGTSSAAATTRDATHDRILQKDCKATNDWMLVSELKNGLQSLIIVLESMAAHAPEFREETGTDANPAAGKNRKLYTYNTAKFQARLKEMEIELRSEVRKCDGLLGGMSLATQMVSEQDQPTRRGLHCATHGNCLLTSFVQEWNFHTRRDARANIIIAYASKRDSSQMKYISFLGMVFLPGTFLAVSTHHDKGPRRNPTCRTNHGVKTLFSMTFFNWIPDDSPQVVSPWIGLYCGSAAMLTLITYWRWRRYIAEQELISHKDIQEKLKSDDSSISTIA